MNYDAIISQIINTLGWIKIHAGFTRNAVTITVSNRSHDIPPEHRQQIFDRFYRGDPARTRRIEGVGIGLSLSREIARAHGGDLTLDHTPSGNTSFTLTLPL
jgi:two-component system heavy metal sensor histidine kinase CusS